MEKSNKKAEFALAGFEDVKQQMISLGVYKPEYDTIIRIYVDLLVQYDTLQKRLESTRYSVQTKSAQGGYKRSPVVAAHEAVRKDILAYSDRLCLNPKSVLAADIPQKRADPLTEAFKDFGL